MRGAIREVIRGVIRGSTLLTDGLTGVAEQRALALVVASRREV